MKLIAGTRGNADFCGRSEPDATVVRIRASDRMCEFVKKGFDHDLVRIVCHEKIADFDAAVDVPAKTLSLQLG